MSNIETVNKYYEELQEAIKIYNERVNYNGEYGEELVQCDESVKDYLKAVIDNGNEHLLTPLFFYYLVIQSDTSPINPDDEEKLDFIDNLKARLENINNYHKKLATIAEYFDIICDEDSSYDFNDIPMSDYEKEMFLTYFKSRKKFQSRDLGTFFFIKMIILILLSYVFDKKLKPEYYLKLANPYITKWRKKLDEMRVQLKIEQDDVSYIGPFYSLDEDQIMDYIIGQIDNSPKEIR